MLQRDRFELLSAYLDGEVTATERRQVEEWLNHDEPTRRLYDRLLKLREGFQGMPLYASQPVDDTVAQVMGRLDQPRRPSRRLMALGGGAIAAAVVAALSSLMGGPLSPQFAKQPVPGSSASLDPALESPIAVQLPATVPNGASGDGSSDMSSDVSSDALMIAIDQPILSMGDDTGSPAGGSPLPSPGADVN